MGKRSKPKAKAGENPVIAGRVSPDLHQKIKDAAKASGRSMSEELAFRAEQAFNFEAGFESIRKVQDQEELVVRLGREAALTHWNIRPMPGRPGWYYTGDVPPQELVAITPSVQTIMERIADLAVERALMREKDKNQ
jgi:hypothetical protein